MLLHNAQWTTGIFGTNYKYHPYLPVQLNSIFLSKAQQGSLHNIYTKLLLCQALQENDKLFKIGPFAIYQTPK